MNLWTFWLISMNWTYASSFGRRKTRAVPLLPILAVRPHRWTKAAALDGGSNWRTQSTSTMSIPRAMTSVQTRRPDSSWRNWSKIFSRFCFIFPWIHNTLNDNNLLAEKQKLCWLWGDVNEVLEIAYSFRTREKYSTAAQVDMNTINFPFSFFLTTVIRADNFLWPSQTT